MGNDYFCPPYLEDFEVKKRVELFRSQFSRCKIFPVDTERLLEKDIGIQIVPLSGLRSEVNTDAFISSNFRTLYIDEWLYNDDRYAYRLRFSVAHELSHLVIHSDIYKRIEITDLASFMSFQDCRSQAGYRRFEIQANAFAGMLLVPAHDLREYVNTERERLSSQRNPISAVQPPSRLLFSIRLNAADYFGVSDDVIQRRMADEHITR